MGLVDRFERLLDRVMPPPDEAVRAHRRAVDLLGRGDVRAALTLAEEARRVAPAWLPARLLQADALAADGRAPEALALLDAAAVEHELPAEALGRVIELAVVVGDVARVREVERQLRGREVTRPAELAARYLSAAERLETAEPDAASRLARAATVLDPTLAAAWLLLARVALTADDAPRARRLLARGAAQVAASDGPNNHAAGALAWRLDERPLAVRLLRRAWICGEPRAAPLLVVALTASDDLSAIERVTRGLDLGLARVVTVLGALARGDAAPGAPVTAEEIPDALWTYAMELALRGDLALATRWATEAPGRPLSAEVLALGEAEEVAARGDVPAAVDRLRAALAAGATRARAAEVLRRSVAVGWGASVDGLLAGLAAWLRGAHPALGAEAASLDALRRSLDEPLRVALLGEFSAGKSSVVNAWVGAPISAVGVLPTTARVYWLRQGPPRRRIIDARGGLREGPLEGIAQAIAAVEAEGGAVAHVEVFHPGEALAHLELLDTPGSNATDGVDPGVTRHALSLADLALWVFDARQAGKQSELDALRAAGAAGVPVLGAVNKTDAVGPGGEAEVTAALTATLGDEAPLLGAFSARAAQADPDDPGWSRFRSAVLDRVVARRGGWKRLRAAVRLASLLSSARDGLALGRASEATRRAREAQLADALRALRDELAGRAAGVRREVASALAEQWPGLRGGRAAPSDDVLRDAIAELVHRCVRREREAMATRRAEVEALAVEAGVVRAGLGGALTAPVDVVVRAAVHEGARDALDLALRPSTLGRSTASASEGVDIGDPWHEVSAALDAARATVDVADISLDVVLEGALASARGCGERLARDLGVKVPDATLEPKV